MIPFPIAATWHKEHEPDDATTFREAGTEHRHAYDYADDAIYRQIDPAIYPTENLDQAYTYDTLHRLATSQVGTLSGSTISGTPASQEAWSPDGLGNWANYITKASGTTNLNETRTASPALCSEWRSSNLCVSRYVETRSDH
jgi:hypothetical protein